jgi:hypothetical protein
VDDGEAPVGKSAPELLLANKRDLEMGLDPTPRWVSAKLDGVGYGLRFSSSFSFNSPTTPAVPITTEPSLSADWAIYYTAQLVFGECVFLPFCPFDDFQLLQSVLELPSNITSRRRTLRRPWKWSRPLVPTISFQVCWASCRLLAIIPFISSVRSSHIQLSLLYAPCGSRSLTIT